MLEGMNAFVTIDTATAENAVTIPVAALNENRAKCFVYTAYNAKTGEPMNPVDVETGLSDVDNVEILSGLKAGDTVFFSFYGQLPD